jgi:hypothetical protein
MDGGLSRAKQIHLQHYNLVETVAPGCVTAQTLLTLSFIAFLLVHETIAPLLSNQDKELQQLEGNPLAFDFKGSSVSDAVCCHETMKEHCAHLFPVSVAGEANSRFVPCEPDCEGVQVLKIDVKIEGAPDDRTPPLSLQPVFALRHVATIVVNHDSRQDAWQTKACCQTDRPTVASLSALHVGLPAACTVSCQSSWPTAASFSAPHANMATLTEAVDCFRRPSRPVRSSFTTCRDRIPMMGLPVKMQGMGHVRDKPTVQLLRKHAWPHISCACTQPPVLPRGITSDHTSGTNLCRSIL